MRPKWESWLFSWDFALLQSVAYDRDLLTRKSLVPRCAHIKCDLRQFTACISLLDTPLPLPSLVIQLYDCFFSRGNRVVSVSLQGRIAVNCWVYTPVQRRKQCKYKGYYIYAVMLDWSTWLLHLHLTFFWTRLIMFLLSYCHLLVQFKNI